MCRLQRGGEKLAYDGTIRLDTGIDETGALKGLSALGSTVAKGAAVAAAALGAMGVAAIKVGADFEASMSQVAATMGTTVDMIPELTAVAKEMGAATQFSATQAAEALNYLALAGYDSQKSIAALPTVLDLAAAGGMDLAYASDLVTDSMSVLGMSTDELVGFVDQMAKTAQKSNTSVAQLGEAILVAGGQAKLAGMDTVELNTALGILADNGLKGSEGGTALRNALKNLYTPTKQAAEALKKLGIETVDGNDNLRDTQTVLQELGFALDGLSEGERIRVMSQIFDTRTIAAGNALLKNSGERWDELSAQIANAEGAASAMARTMNDNLKGDITILGSALEGLGIQIYDHFNAPLREAAQAGIQAVNKLARELAKPDMQRSLEALAGAFSSLITVASKLVTGAIQLLVAGFGTLADNATTLIFVLTTLIAAFVAFQVLTTVNTMLAASAAGFTLLETAMLAMPVVMNAVTGATGLLTAAQTALNAAWIANPIGLIIAGVAALTAGIVALVLWINRDSEAEKQLKKEKEELIEVNNALIDSVDDSAKSYEDARKGINTEADAARSLAKRLFELDSAQLQTTEGQARMRVLVGQLNQAMPELGLAIDEETGLLNMNAAAVEKVIAAKQEQAKLQAANERAVELEKQLLDIETQRVLIQDKIAEAKLQLEAETIKQKAYNEIVAELTEELNNLKVAEGDVSTALQVLTESQIASNQALEEMGLSEAQLALAKQQAAVNELANSWGMASDSITEAMERTGLSSEEFAEKVAGHSKAITNSFEEIPASFDKSLDELMEIQRINIERYADFQRNIQELSGKLTAGALEELAALGPGANSILQELIDGGEAKWNEYNALYEQRMQVSVDSAIGAVSDGRLPAATAAAISAAAGAVAQNPKLETAFTDQAAESSESFKEELEGADLPGYADETVDDVGKTIKDNPAVKNAVVQQVEDAYSAADSEVQAIGFWQIGETMMQSLADGICNGTGLIESAAREASRRAYEAARDELDSHSHSRKFKYLEQMSVKGYGDELLTGKEVWGKALSQSMSGALATLDAQRYTVASGHAASIVNNSSTVSDGDVIFEEGAIQIHVEKMESEADLERIAAKASRRIGEKTAQRRRLKGGLVPG